MEWKSAMIVPVPKVKKQGNLSDWRPISLLPTLSKVFEKLLYQQLSTHCSHHGLIIDKQSGFRSEHSCKSSLVCAMEYIHMSLDAGLNVAVVSLDLEKALDSVNHCMLRKLAEIGVQGRDMAKFPSYLSMRTQFTRYFKEFSGVASVTGGVPQGSILGPLLFVLFTDDLLRLPLRSRLFCYADDTKLFFAADTYENVKNVLKEDLCSIDDFLTQCNLTLN